ncbi:MAG: pyridoxal phosphate-dependent aminotransferase [Tenacibaculum sp.]
MLNNLSDRIKCLPTSATLAMAAKARELRNDGKEIINLSLGEPDFDTPNFIKEAAILAINQNYNSYTPVDGYEELKEAVSFKFNRDNNLNYTPSQIVVSTGAKQSIANIAQVLLNPGDEILLSAPYWVSYTAIATLCQANIVELPTTIKNDFKITPQQLEEAITAKTKMIFFNSPNNPSGSVYSETELRALSEVLEKHPQVFVLSDEIYEHINYSDKLFSFACIKKMYERTITVNGLSKAFAMTGWRIGYIGAPQWIAKACTKMQGQITSGTNCIAQRAAITALTTSPKKIAYMATQFKERRDLVLASLEQIPEIVTNTPQGAFYIFPDISSYFGKIIRGKEINNADDFSMLLLQEAHVATVTGRAFGTPNCIRLSYAASELQLKEAIKRIKKVLS